jgi:hypothetical protein
MGLSAAVSSWERRVGVHAVHQEICLFISEAVYGVALIPKRATPTNHS